MYVQVTVVRLAGLVNHYVREKHTTQAHIFSQLRSNGCMRKADFMTVVPRRSGIQCIYSGIARVHKPGSLVM